MDVLVYCIQVIINSVLHLRNLCILRLSLILTYAINSAHILYLGSLLIKCHPMHDRWDLDSLELAAISFYSIFVAIVK